MDLAQWRVIVFGAWLITVGRLMLARPRSALRFPAMAASTNLINYGEITLRLLTGLALITGADESQFPAALRIVGWFIAVSSVGLYFVPRKWHAKYAVWWSQKLAPAWLRLAAPVSLAAGILPIVAVA